MVSRAGSIAVFLFAIVFASVVAGTNEGRGRGPHDDGTGKPQFRGGHEGRGNDDGDDARIRQGFEIAPVALRYKRKDRDLVGLGSYIVNAQGGCNDCHTNPPFAPGGNPFLGQPKVINSANYLAGGVAFGPFISRNLTPDVASGLPANLTFEEFKQTMRTGVDLKHLPPFVPSSANDLLQVMPWPVFQEMIDRDLLAIYKFLSAIPHAEPGT